MKLIMRYAHDTCHIVQQHASSSRFLLLTVPFFLSTMTDIIIIYDEDTHVKDELPLLFTPVKHCKRHLVFPFVLIRFLSIGV